MAYAKQTWVKYDANKSEEENIQNGAVGTAERLNHMESGIETVDQLADKHIKDKSNPHSTTAAQVGLGSVSNYGIATTAEATAGTVNNKYMTPFLVSEALKSLKDAISKAQSYSTTLITTQDWDTLKSPGIYYVGGASGANKPDKATTMYGYLEIFSDGKTVLHRFNSFNDEICTRAYSGNPSVWKPWKVR